MSPKTLQERNFIMNRNLHVNEPVQENVLAGTVGAFLFALVGGVVWFLLYQLGVLAAISGIVAVICAIRGYSFFSKKESLKGIVISVIMSIIVILIAWYACLSMDIYTVYQEWYAEGEVDFTLTFFESAKAAPLFLAEPEIARAYFRDLIIGLAFCGIGCIQPVTQAIKKLRAPAAPAEPQNPTEEF